MLMYTYGFFTTFETLGVHVQVTANGKHGVLNRGKIQNAGICMMKETRGLGQRIKMNLYLNCHVKTASSISL